MADLTYEQAMARLEEIAEKLEDGSLSLDESIKLLRKVQSWQFSATIVWRKQS